MNDPLLVSTVISERYLQNKTSSPVPSKMKSEIITSQWQCGEAERGVEPCGLIPTLPLPSRVTRNILNKLPNAKFSHAHS